MNTPTPPSHHNRSATIPVFCYYQPLNQSKSRFCISRCCTRLYNQPLFSNLFAEPSINFWHVKIEPNSINGLNKASAIDTLQLRGMDLQRFIRKLGGVSEITMLEIVAAITTVIEFEV
ncbi:hypothetical protein MiAbW_03293 [Microcystis aeruginosa NIES-4325]|uniref:Uncharacterized protein n=1 Tax=Microcystis aeruginosa NIES-4325 TaxID=2569534 RepID=A0A5J4FE09_MICAE|nr:type II toxin-antitoxin system PemK/MazF family toxin [Microcystis aeruginosa]GEA28715.1 hypothetical protein MiAbW_03293 [Microcystis aeruginosa NIES-4325]